MAKKFAVSIKDNGPLSFRWSKYVFEKGKPPKIVEKEEDAEYLRGNGLHVREMSPAEAARSPHDKARGAAPAAPKQVEPEPVDEDEVPDENVTPSASEALESMVPPTPAVP